MEKKHNLKFCISCGAKLDGDEIICPSCGFTLVESSQSEDKVMSQGSPVPPLPPPMTETVKSVKPVTEEAETDANKQPSAPKKSGSPFTAILLIIVLLAVVIAATGFLQYKGIVHIELLDDFVKPPVDVVESSSNYYIAHSSAVIGTDKIVILSNTISASNKNNNKKGALLKFTKLMKRRYPKDFYKFKNSSCKKFTDITEASKYRKNLMKKFKRKKYKINFINVRY